MMKMYKTISFFEIITNNVYMPEKYDLKLNPIIKKIIDLYLIINPDPLSQRRFASDHLRLLIHGEVNRILDYLNTEKENNPKVKEILQKKEYKEVLKALETNSRFKT